jgi:hypothetical protein
MGRDTVNTLSYVLSARKDGVLKAELEEATEDSSIWLLF